VTKRTPSGGIRRGEEGNSRNKRQDILAAAVEHFGRQGYEYTKWADIAADVGLGATALYHYFESKLHCLYEIQIEALEAERERFNRLSAEGGEFGPVLLRLLDGLFDISEHEVLRNRVLVAETGLLSVRRDSPREEDARRRARAQTRELEFTWAAFLTRGMEQGAIPQADPRLLTFALLGLYNSVWHWYRPAGGLTLAEVREFFIERCLAVVGYSDGAVAPAERPPRAVSARKAA
jgi:AcrR family transcriptional regulator